MEDKIPYQAPKAVSLEELERRKGEFDIPEGAIAAYQAGGAPTVVFLRSTGEPYQLVSPNDDRPTTTTLGEQEGTR
jgi:hypothetical protein